jgi:ABC-type multidrug transport system fused ATPase/permease subunit
MAFISGMDFYYWAITLHTVLKLQIKSLLDLFMMVILLLGSVVTFLALMMISSTIAWVHLGLWILMFCFMGYKNRKELDQERVVKEKQEALRREQERLEEEARITVEKAKLAEFLQNAPEVSLKMREELEDLRRTVDANQQKNDDMFKQMRAFLSEQFSKIERSLPTPPA